MQIVINISKSHALILSTLLFIIVIGIAADYATSAATLTQWHPLSEIAVDGIRIESTTSPGKINASYIEGGGGGQWMTSGSDIYYNDGNVGIGTMSPGILSSIIKLQVEGGINFGDSATETKNHLTAQGPNFVLNKKDAAGGFYFRKNSVAGDPDVYTDLMLIDNSGNVGVGTTGPDSKLHVLGGRTRIGSISQNYMPADTNWNYNLLLDSQDTTSIGFHDSGASVSSIRYDTSGFTIGGDDGWGVKQVLFPGGIRTSGAESKVVEAVVVNCPTASCTGNCPSGKKILQAYGFHGAYASTNINIQQSGWVCGSAISWKGDCIGATSCTQGTGCGSSSVYLLCE